MSECGTVDDDFLLILDSGPNSAPQPFESQFVHYVFDSQDRKPPGNGDILNGSAPFSVTQYGPGIKKQGEADQGQKGPVQFTE